MMTNGAAADLAPSRAGALGDRGRSVFDGSAVRASERFDAWAGAVSENFVPLCATLADRETRSAFQGRLVAQPMGRAEMSTVRGSAMSVCRSAAMIARADPGHIKLGLQVRGRGVISQDGRESVLEPGDFALYDTTRPYTLRFGEAFTMFVVMFPIEQLRVDRRTLAAVTAVCFSGRRGLGAVTSSSLAEMSRQLEAGPLEGGLPLTDAVFDLLTAGLAERFGGRAGDGASRRRALLMQIEAYITERLADPGLSVPGIAAAHHISLRTLQKLFEKEGETASGWIRRRRLEQARRDLANPALRAVPVAAVGASCGFFDAAGFSRAFRAEFAKTPSEFRASVADSAA